MTARPIREWCADYHLARYLKRRCKWFARETEVVRRLSDGAYFAASSPQNMGRAMASLFDKSAPKFTLVRCREWRGILIASPRVFWLPQSGEFRLLKKQKVMWLHRWPLEKEEKLMDALEDDYRAAIHLQGEG